MDLGGDLGREVSSNARARQGEDDGGLSDVEDGHDVYQSRAGGVGITSGADAGSMLGGRGTTRRGGRHQVCHKDRARGHGTTSAVAAVRSTGGGGHGSVDALLIFLI
jgi:hypothetical protein